MGPLSGGADQAHRGRGRSVSAPPPSEDLDAREREQEPAEEQRDEGERHAHLRVLDEADLDARRSRGLDDDEVGHGAEDCEVAGERDRKSTRLNSSHTVISYAVFCLKKKTTKIGF